MLNVLFVCLGNICRSPLGEGIFKYLIEEEGLNDVIKVDSCGTSAYHIGELADKRMREVAFSHGVRLTSRARQLKKEDELEYDYIIAMDESNYQNILKKFEIPICNSLYLMREFDENNQSINVPDPYYGGIAGFEEVYQIVYRSSVKLLNKIKQDHGL